MGSINQLIDPKITLSPNRNRDPKFHIKNKYPSTAVLKLGPLEMKGIKCVPLPIFDNLLYSRENVLFIDSDN